MGSWRTITVCYGSAGWLGTRLAQPVEFPGLVVYIGRGAGGGAALASWRLGNYTPFERQFEEGSAVYVVLPALLVGDELLLLGKDSALERYGRGFGSFCSRRNNFDL